MTEAAGGLRVLDLSTGPAGGIASMVLADFGADVIKVEQPGGDPYRSLAAAPMWLRGKRSIELDLKSNAGQRRLHELVQDADVVLSSYRPGDAERLAADAETLRALNPALVYCSVTGFGPKGPWSGYRGYEGVVAAKAGRMMTFSGSLKREGPIYPYVQVGTHVSAHSAVQGILGALMVRDITGQGQVVETSLLQGMMPYDLGGLVVQQLQRRLPSQFPTNPWGSTNTMPTLQYHPVLAKDGRWMQMGNLVEHLFHSFIAATDLGEIYADERYQGPPNGFSEEAREELRDKILRRMREKDSAEWQQIFIENGNVASELYQPTQDALLHPQLIHNGNVIDVQTKRYGAMKQIGPVAKLLETPAEINPDAPAVGEHQTAAWKPRQAVPAAGPSEAPAPRRPLEGVTIVEFATIIATPYACSILGDLGARIIKVEATDGDQMRGMAQGVAVTKTTATKEGICVDLKTPEGREIARKLVSTANAVIHNMRPGVPERLGLGYEDVRAENPNVVYVSATGYGSDGPYAHRPNAHPVPGAGLGGAYYQAGAEPAMTVTDDIDVLRETARQLMRANEVNPDPNTSLVIATAAMLGLYVQRTQGIGQHIQCNMMGANAYANFDDFLSYEGKPERPTPLAGLYGLSATYRLYPAASGWVFLACPSDHEWRNMARAMGADQLLADARFQSIESRAANDEVLAEALAAVFKTRPADEWESVLTDADVACVRADEGMPAEVFDRSEHMRENGFVTEVEHLRFGPHWRTGALVNFSETPARPGAGVLAGQHTRPILRELGYANAEIEDLYARRVVASEPV
jgi:crotonobetainyl-CoA:carnitine CoA-transferase CaiB-like acyl-CoA transferase